MYVKDKEMKTRSRYQSQQTIMLSYLHIFFFQKIVILKYHYGI